MNPFDAWKASKASAERHTMWQPQPQEKPKAKSKYAPKGTREDRLPQIANPWGLTPTECYILVGLVDGKELTEIAKELFISIKTASTYRTRANEKMRARSGVQAVVHWDRFHRKAAE